MNAWFSVVRNGPENERKTYRTQYDRGQGGNTKSDTCPKRVVQGQDSRCESLPIDYTDVHTWGTKLDFFVKYEYINNKTVFFGLHQILTNICYVCLIPYLSYYTIDDIQHY